MLERARTALERRQQAQINRLQNRVDELENIIKLKDQLVINVADNSPKDIRTAVRTPLVVNKTFQDFDSEYCECLTRSAFSATKKRLESNDLRPSQELRPEIVQNEGIHLAHIQLIISFILFYSFPSCLNQKGKNILFISIPKQFQIQRRRTYDVPISADYKVGTIEHYKLFLLK
ncbi:MAG: hypothetical protein EZS28_000630 [Streblomastix strix]|uniref:Uncharacterized protein n=1 Tax=Streblomastix strix TaxID=222440 RepID=A0A5J4X9G1_9EUKA|nr:MAG: hypothetical protein EZS28_000630 [Streblomastix strix]